jgi:23S rRNA pseudouridine955/2504/2580 synthase
MPTYQKPNPEPRPPAPLILTAAKDDHGRRLDRILRKALPELSLSLIHRLLRQKKILVDNKPATPNHRIEQGMVIQIIASVNHISNQVNHNFVNHKKLKVNKKNPRLQTPNPEHRPLASKPQSSNPATRPLTLKSRSPTPDPRPPTPILWQGSGIIVFNKPQGLSTHGPQSLDSVVKAWLKEEDALPRSLSFRPGPLHRLDKPTSGIIIFSQTLEGAKLFSALLRERKLEKTYIAIIEGSIEKEKRTEKKEKSKRIKYDEIIWRDALEHDKDAHKSFISPEPKTPNPEPRTLTPILKEALTTVKTLASNGKYSLIEARIKTGRHHQIRAQAASHGHPLAGDIKYGAKPLPGQTRGGEFFLHAWKIKFTECPDGFPQEITAPLPEAFQAKIEALFKR